MNLNSGALFPLIAATLLLITLTPHKIEAGLTSYLPSASFFNPLNWIWSSPKNSTVSRAEIEKRADNSTGKSWDKNHGEQKKNHYGTVTEKFQKIFLPNRETNISVDLNENPTISTPNNNRSFSFVGSVRDIFTTTHRPKLVSNSSSTSGGRFNWMRIKKKGKPYEVPVVTSFSNYTNLQSYQSAYEFSPDEKKTGKISETTEILVDNLEPKQRVAKNTNVTKSDSGRWFSSFWTN